MTEEIQQRQSVLASEKKGEGSGARYLSFSLGAGEYAIPLLAVREVIAMPEFTPIPNTPAYFLGIMNLRGQVISVIDLRHKLGIKALNSPETAVIICDLSPLSIGVVVDSINSVLSPADSELSPRPDIQSSANSEYVTGVYRKEKSLVLFLDLAKTLNVEDKTALARGAGRKAA
jgi:purine-binding chemotaxis protein CheW